MAFGLEHHVDKEVHMGLARYQLGSYSRQRGPDVSRNRVWAKRQMNRFWRRLARKDPANAPTRRPTKYWWD